MIKKIKNESLGFKLELITNRLSGDINFIDILCKNYPQVSLLQYNNYEAENKAEKYDLLEFDFEHDKINFIWYLIMKAANIFYEKQNRYPGQTNTENDNINNEFEKDIPFLKECLNEFLNSNGKIEKLQGKLDLSEITDNYLYEFCRFTNSQIVPAVSIICSIASQEIIKLITYQFKAVNSTIIFDGINSSVTAFNI